MVPAGCTAHSASPVLVPAALLPSLAVQPPALACTASPLRSAMAAPAAAASSSSAVAAAAAPTPAVPTAADPFPHLREYFTDSNAVAAALPADTPIIEESYTPAEVELMAQLRDAVAAMVKDPAQMVMTPDDIPGGMHQHWTNYWPEGKDHPLFEDKVSAKDADPEGWPQHELIRFLRARDMNLKKATKMYFHYKRWRVIFGASHIASLPTGPRQPLVSSILSASYHKWDRHGRPLYIQKSGLIDVRRFTTEMSLPQIAVGHTWFTEEMRRRAEIGSRMTGRRVDKLVMIIDAHNVGISARKLMKIFSTTTYIDQNFSPEFMGTMYIINVPAFFPVVWRLAQPFLAPATQKKIKILGRNFQQTLVEDLGAECLPVEYGGTCACAGGCCPVPSGKAPRDPYAEDGDEETFTLKAGHSTSIELPLLGRAAPSADDGAAAAAASAPAQPEEAFWSISVASRDVDFSVEFRPTPALAEGAQLDEAEELAPIVVLPVTRVDASAAAPLTGSYASDAPGVLHFTISNAYSRWHSKTATIRTGTRIKA